MTAYQNPRFPIMPVDEAHLRQALPMAICGRQICGDTLTASFPTNPATVGDWFLCTENVAFRIIRLDGQAVHMQRANGPAMADLLDRIDPLLSEIEMALGLTLQPLDMGPRPESAIPVARITLGSTTQIDLAIAADTSFLPMAAPLASSLLGHIPIPISLLMDGPRLSPADAATLAPGDLLLIGAAPLSASLVAPNAPPIQGRITPQDRQFRPDYHKVSE